MRLNALEQSQLTPYNSQACLQFPGIPHWLPGLHTADFWGGRHPPYVPSSFISDFLQKQQSHCKAAVTPVFRLAHFPSLQPSLWHPHSRIQVSLPFPNHKGSFLTLFQAWFMSKSSHSVLKANEERVVIPPSFYG